MYRDDFVCKKCYELAKAKRFSTGFAIILMIIAVIICFTGVGVIIGIPAIMISRLLLRAAKDTTINALTVYRVFKTIGIIIVGLIVLSMLGGIGGMIQDFFRYGF